MSQELQLLKARMREYDLIPSETDVAAFLGFLFGPGECQGTCHHCATCGESCTCCVGGSSAGS